MIVNRSRNMDDKGHFGDVSARNKEYVTRQWRKGGPCYKVAKNLAELCSYSCVLQNVELVNDEIG